MASAGGELSPDARTRVDAVAPWWQKPRRWFAARMLDEQVARLAEAVTISAAEVARDPPVVRFLLAAL